MATLKSGLGVIECSVFVHVRLSVPTVGKPESVMKPKPTRSAAPRLLPNGQPDQSNVVCSEHASRLIAAAIARGLPAFARL